MTKLLIIYESRTGGTEAMAKAVYEGAVSVGANVSLKKVTEATMDDLMNCDAVVFGTPTNFNYMAGTIKEFFDQVWLHLRKTEASKPYTAFAIGRDDAESAIRSIDKVCNEFAEWASFKFKKVHQAVTGIRHRPSPEVLEECKRLGREMAQL